MKHDLDYYLALNYPIEVVRSKEGIFVFHPDLDGCAAQGDTIEEAISNLDSARQLWLTVRCKDGLPIEEPVNEEDCNGRYSLRTSARLHAEVLKISRRQHISVNQLLNNIIASYVGGNHLQQQVLEIVREIKSQMVAGSPVTLLQPTSMTYRAVSTGPSQRDAQQFGNTVSNTSPRQVM